MIVDILKVVVGVGVNVQELKFVTGGEIVGGHLVHILITELVLELMEFLVELVVQVVTEDLEGVIITQDL